MSTASLDTYAAVKTLREADADEAMAEAIVNTANAAAGVDRGEPVTRGEFYRALWILAVALIGAQIAIAGFVVHLLTTADRPPPRAPPGAGGTTSAAPTTHQSVSRENRRNRDEFPLDRSS